MAGEGEDRRVGAALLVGIGAYRQADRVVPLRYAARDAEALAELLTDPNVCGFPADRVRLLTDAAARREDVVHSLSKWLPEASRGAALCVVYFAGHGAVQRVGLREEGFLLTHDADPDDLVTRGVAMSDVARWIEGVEAGAVVVCLDCCHAGKVVTHRGPAHDPAPAHGPGAAARDMRLRPSILQQISGRGRFLLASCDEGQTSVEAEAWGHGLFTYHLLRGLRGAGDRDSDGRVGVAELFEYVAESVERDARALGAEQRPWYSAVGTGGVFLSAPAATAAGPGAAPDRADEPERVWREHGAADAAAAIERALPDADDGALIGMLDLLGRMNDPAGVPTVFRLLAHGTAAVRLRARKVLHAYGWARAAADVEALARSRPDGGIDAVLEGLAAFESHREVVALLDRLVTTLRGDLRNRAILLLERKRLGLEVEKTAEVFREIHSPYRIVRALGQGVFTAALLARDEENDLDVVVRVLRPEFAGQPHLRARFLDLTRRSVRFVHQNLVLTREARAFPDRDLYYAVRDHVVGPTLQRRLEAGQAFAPGEAFAVVRQLLEALTPVHGDSAVHGGVKPSNIFVAGESRVVLGDVSLMAAGAAAGSDRLSYDYRYAPPEWFRGRPEADPRSDLYAIGCVAYELACGRPPFVSDNPFELAARHDRGDVEPPARLGSALGPAGDGFVLRLLARSPDDRFPTIAAALRELTAVERPPGETPTEEATIPPSPLPPRPSRRWPPPGRDEDLVSIVRFGAADPDGPPSGIDSGLAGSPDETLPPDGGVGAAAAPEKAPEAIGRYTVARLLGQGGMGMVYEALDEGLGRRVAIKLVRLAGPSSPGIAERFLREARSVASLQHPNIVQVFDIGRHVRPDGGYAYIVQEFMEGGTLAAKLRDLPVWPAAEAARLVRTLAGAVAYAHSRGIVHRDLKPANILLARDGTPKVADFGLAKNLEEDASATLVGTIMGTPAYMAPEMVRGAHKDVTGAVDVFSLGVVLYELLTGRRPFEGEGLMELLHNVMFRDPSPPRQLNESVPADLEHICLKCLQKDPPARYPDAGPLERDLASFLDGGPVTAAPPGAPGGWRRWFSMGKQGPRG